MNNLLSITSFIVIAIDSFLAILFLSSIIRFKNITIDFLSFLFLAISTAVTSYFCSSHYTRYFILFLFLLIIVFLLSDSDNGNTKRISAAVFLSFVFGGIRILYEILIEKSFSAFPSDTTLQPCLVRLFNIVMSRFLLTIVVLIVRNRNALSTYSLSQISLLFLYVCFSFFSVIVLADQFANSSPFDDFIVVCSILYGIGCCIYVLLFFSVKKRDERIREDSLIIQKLENEYIRYKNTDRYLEDLEAWKHDMRKHFQSILSIMNSADPEKEKLLSSYLSNIQEGLDQTHYFINTKNPLFDSIVSVNCLHAVDSQIEVQLDMIVPQLSFIDSVDLVSILGNLWENAIEGCIRADEEKNFNTSIIFKTFVNINHFVMELTNTSVSNLDTSLHTSKSEPGHGIGTKVIKRLVDKYHGVYGYKILDNTIVSRVAIPVNSYTYDGLSSCTVVSWSSANK